MWLPSRTHCLHLYWYLPLVSYPAGHVLRAAMSLQMGNEPSTDASGPGLALRVLSWNIDGLDGRDIEKRTRAVIDFIKHRSPHVVYLQEVVPQTLSMLHAKLDSSYSIHISPKITCMYFPVIMVTKQCAKVTLDSEIGMFDFSGTTMGRHLLQLFVKVCGVPMALYTSHLESMKDYSAERKSQLATSFKFIDEQNKQFDRVCIFGGDLNLRDYEVTAVGLPESTVDVWEACGSVEENRYTWDITANDNLVWNYPNKPRLRFDRLYLTAKTSQQVKPSAFELVGKERISCGRFPSDHWGMFVTFDITELIVID